MRTRFQIDRNQTTYPSGESGFMLVAVVVMVALVLIALSVAAPVVARELRRDKEIESQHRMEQYVRAIQLYQRKFPNQYPASIKALEGTNNIRYLRKQYVDPLTGKADYKLIHQGEQKTKIHVFFGKDLSEVGAGLGGGLGSAAGMASSGGNGTPIGGSSTSTIGNTSALASGFSGASITTGGGGATGANGASGTSGTNGTSGSGTGSGSGGGGMFGDSTGGVIVGVGTSRTGASVTEPNGQTTYETWEFWYDPRIEALKKSVSLTGGGMSSQAASSFGQDATSGQPNSGMPGAGTPGIGTPGIGTPGIGTPGAGTPGTTTPTSPTSPNPF
jgi:type II secretory pathway pseudopilin PulG